MAKASKIRHCRPNDDPSITALYTSAFPQENLLPLVQELRRLGPSFISLVSTNGVEITGHIGLTICEATNSSQKLCLLGPLCVIPAAQKTGLGSALIDAGMDHMKSNAVQHVLVLGDPNYYGRFNFRQENHILPPYPIPSEWKSAWQGLCISSKSTKTAGTLIVPPPWRNAELWAE